MNEKEILEETWKDVPGFEGIYFVSDLGRIKRYNGKIRILTKGGNGYEQVMLTHNTEAELLYIHRLVALAFIPNPENKPCVNHKDGNKLNNQVVNLEWVTYSENMRHSYLIGLNCQVGERAGRAKLNELQVRVIRKTEGLMYKELALIFGVSTSVINNVRNRRTWTHI